MVKVKKIEDDDDDDDDDDDYPVLSLLIYSIRHYLYQLLIINHDYDSKYC